MEDPVYLSDEHVLSRMLASETRQEMVSYFESRIQCDFNEQDRRQLAEWMRDVCQAEECQPDIFPLSMLIVDRFLALIRTKKQQLQLTGATALLLASKLRQTSQIPAKHLVYYTQDLISLDELRHWELLILSTLKWDLALITPVDYLDIFIKRMKLSDEQMISDIEDKAQLMIIECCLEYKYSLYPPSVIAWASLMGAMKTWHLGSDQLRLTTSVVAANARLLVSSGRRQPAAESRQNNNNNNNQENAKHQIALRHQHQPPPHHHHYQNNGLNHCALQANLAALEWA